MVRPRRHQRRAARPPRAPTPPPAAPSAPPRGRLARILKLAERIAAFVEAGGGRVLRWLVAAWLRRLVRSPSDAGDAGRRVEAVEDGAEELGEDATAAAKAVPVQEESATAAPLVEEGGPGEGLATAVAPKADPFEDGYALAELFEDGADELGEDPTARVLEGATAAAQERAPGATPLSKQAEFPRDKRAGEGRADDGDARRPREDAGGSNPSGNVSSAKAPRFPREERRNRKHGEGARTAPAPSPAEDAVAGSPPAAKEEGRGRQSSSTSSPRHQEEDERERGEASGANTGHGHPSSSSPSAALGVHHENGELGEGGATASPTAGEVRGRVEGKNANTAATDDRGDSDDANSIATADPGEGHDPASPRPRAPETGDASAAASADRATAEPIPANQKAQERGGTHTGALETPAGDSDVVRVQPHFAASPAASASGEASGSRTRRRQRFVPRKKNKKAKPKASPLLIEVHQCDPDESIEEEVAIEEDLDLEIQMHQTYRDKCTVCRKKYMYCLICHLENKEKELLKDQNTVMHHCKSEHQCAQGGILCRKTGCFVRAKCNRDIGLHQYVCHKLP